MVIWWYILELNWRLMISTITLKKIGGFIVNALIRRNDPVGGEEVGASTVGGNEVSLLSALKGLCMNVVSTVHDKNVLSPTFGRNWETSSEIRMTNIIEIDCSSVYESAIGRAGCRDRITITICFVQGLIGSGISNIWFSAT